MLLGKNLSSGFKFKRENITSMKVAKIFVHVTFNFKHVYHDTIMLYTESRLKKLNLLYQ